jgi:hypothetical protein
MAEARGSKVVSHAARKQRLAMVANLERLIAREYPNASPTAAYEAIGEATGNSLSTMQRVMSGKTGPSIDTLADIAWHLGATVSEILTIETGQSQSSGKDPFKRTHDRGPDQAKLG